MPFNEETTANPLAREDFYVAHIGITYPDTTYTISRRNVQTTVIEYVLNGSGTIELGGKTYYVTKGDCYIIPAHTIHTYYSDQHDPFTKMWVNVVGSLADSLLAYYFEVDKPIIGHCDISSELSAIHHSIKQHIPHHHDTLLINYHHILHKVKEHLITDIAPLANELTFSKQLTIYINNHIYEPFSITQLAQTFFMTPEHLIRRFKKEQNITPYQYYLDCKMTLAKHLLENNTPVSTICTRLHFTNPSYFSILFKQKTGLSPAEWRRTTHITHKKNTP